MSISNSYDRTRFLDELNSPLESQGQGVFTPAQQRSKLLANIYGNAAFDSTVLVSPTQVNGAVGDKFTLVPNVASGGVLAAHITQVMTHSIRIKSVDGTLYYVMVTNAATNRTGGA